MPSITEDVHTAIDQDIYLQVALIRDYVNKAAVARWLQRYRGIDGSVDGILDAMKKYDLPEEGSREGLWEAVRRVSIPKVRPVWLLVLERSEQSTQRLTGLFEDDDVLPYQKAWQIVPSSGSITIVVDEKYKEAVIEHLGAELLNAQPEPLLQVILKEMTTGEAVQEKAGEPGALRRMDVGPLGLTMLSLQDAGVPVRHVATGQAEHFLMVPREYETRTCNILTELFHGSSE